MTSSIFLHLLVSGGILLASVRASSFKHNMPSIKLPMVYEYFRNSSGDSVGLEAGPDGFKLNGKRMTIISGSMTYYRIHPDYWRDRLKKLRGMGANTVETYVPWNLHEPRMGEFDFGNGTNDMSMFLNITKYLRMAQEEDLLVLLRPGPYICAEWDFGGLPSWLQRDPSMRVRTDHPWYLRRVKEYYDTLLPLLADLQFTRGGPIIGIQVENEYASFNKVSKDYLEYLMQLYEDHGFANETLMFTSDGAWNGDKGTLPDRLLMTANFQGDVDGNFGMLREYQPDKPVMAMEFWAGWFDHWFEHHHTLRPGTFLSVLDDILGKWNGSVNIFMFHGGTNFGFMNGANTRGESPFYDADVTSYDYDALLSESGDYTLKYHLARTLIEEYQVPKIKPTEMIHETVKRAYPTIRLEHYLAYENIISQVPKSSKFEMEKTVSMEHLPMNKDSGQSYGYIIYRKVIDISNGTYLEAGPVRDFGLILIDGELQQTGFREGDYWIRTFKNLSLHVERSGQHVLDLFIENTGRINFGNDIDFLQEKGLHNGTFKLDGKDITDVEIISLEFKSEWVANLTNWNPVSDQTIPKGPTIFKSTFEIADEPTDTWVDMSDWHKGIVFVNNFNIGRYFRVGPQQALFVPGPFLKRGANTITIFEQLEPANQVVFRDEPNLGPVITESKWKMCEIKAEPKSEL